MGGGSGGNVGGGGVQEHVPGVRGGAGRKPGGLILIPGGPIRIEIKKAGHL